MHLENAWRCCGVLVLLCAAACASGSRADAANAAAPPAAASTGTPAPEAPVTSPAGDEVDAGVEETPKDCNFRVKGFCFKTDEEACAAAGCDATKCLILESYPARVKCRE